LRDHLTIRAAKTATTIQRHLEKSAQNAWEDLAHKFSAQNCLPRLSHNDWYSAQQGKLALLSESTWNSISDKQFWRWCKDDLLDKDPENTSNMERCDEQGSNTDRRVLKFRDITVGTVLDALRKPNKFLLSRSPELTEADGTMFKELDRCKGLFRGPSSWRAVLEAAAEVTRRRSARDASAVRTFHLARPSGESFSSLVLEIWFSEVLEQCSWRERRAVDAKSQTAQRSGAETFLKRLNSFNEDDQYSVIDLVRVHEKELFMTWMLLVESIDFGSLVDRDNRFTLKEDKNPTPAVMVRHWYKTAAVAPSAHYTEEPALPVRLPGYFATRGDWYLAMAAGSRSYRLGTRALDLLNSRRANINRLQNGLGLPVRDIADPQSFERFRTKLSYVDRRQRRSTVSYAAMVSLGADSTLSYLCPGEILRSPDRDIDTARLPFFGVRDPGNAFYWVWRS
jgi:hypothetical protein